MEGGEEEGEVCDGRRGGDIEEGWGGVMEGSTHYSGYNYFCCF